MYNANLVIDPRMAGVFRCKDCHMNFNSQHLLTKHKLKFCVGSTGDPDDLQLRRGFRSTSPRRILSPDDDRDEYRRNPNQDQQLRSLAENHGRQMEYLNLRNRDLEKQREDIRKQLENLGRRTVVPPQHDNTADLLRELREQEIRNQRALDDLKRQLIDLQGNQKVNVIEVEKPVYHQPPPPPPPPPEPPKRSLVFPVYYGKSLVAEITAIRQAYLQNGGNDPDVLAQMSQMQAEAQAIEDQMNQKPLQKSPRERPKDNATTLNFLEMENERLNQELRLLQEQNLLAQNRRKSDKEGKSHKHHSRDVCLHISLPKSVFGDKPRRKHNIYKKDNLPQMPERDQQLVGIIQASQPYTTSYASPQQPYLTIYSFPQEQPITQSYNYPQQTQNWYDPSYKQAANSEYYARRRDNDSRSFRSEPNKRSGERIVKYTASHNPDGTIKITRSSSFHHQRRPPYVPPLNLRDLSTPSAHKHSKDSKPVQRKPPKESKLPDISSTLYKPQPFTSKLSHVSEGAEPTPHSQAGVKGQESRLPTATKPGSRLGQIEEPEDEMVDEPQVYNYTESDERESPVSERDVNSREDDFDTADKNLDSPTDEKSPVEDEESDTAWQVRRSSPVLYNTYEY